MASALISILTVSMQNAKKPGDWKKKSGVFSTNDKCYKETVSPNLLSCCDLFPLCL